MVFGRISGDSWKTGDFIWFIMYSIYLGISGSSEKSPDFCRNPSLCPIDLWAQITTGIKIQDLALS